MFKRDDWPKRLAWMGLVACAVLVTGTYLGGSKPGRVLAVATAPSLGTAQSFAVLAGSAVTNTGPTVVIGNLGVSPGTAVSGFPPGMVTGGTIHAADAVALQAQNDVTTAYNVLAGEPCDVDLTGQDLGSRTLTPGVYCFSSSAQLTGALVLNALGNPNAVFVFKIGSTLTTASNSSVAVINASAPQGCNVFWQVGSSATLGTGTTFVGNILALTSIALVTGTNVSGRALARNGAVTMDTNHVSPTTCSQVTPTPTTSPTASPTTSPTASPTTVPPVFILPVTFPSPSPVPTGFVPIATAPPTTAPAAGPAAMATASGAAATSTASGAAATPTASGAPASGAAARGATATATAMVTAGGATATPTASGATVPPTPIVPSRPPKTGLGGSAVQLASGAPVGAAQRPAAPAIAGGTAAAAPAVALSLPNTGTGGLANSKDGTLIGRLLLGGLAVLCAVAGAMHEE
ncbi:MAG TPA: ice-binding family protein [Dehalococcoidia bacterium]|nr:ice-binding family protein [Dehalococcoidia bacterium]